MLTAWTWRKWGCCLQSPFLLPTLLARIMPAEPSYDQQRSDLAWYPSGYEHPGLDGRWVGAHLQQLTATAHQAEALPGAAVTPPLLQSGTAVSVPLRRTRSWSFLAPNADPHGLGNAAQTLQDTFQREARGDHEASRPLSMSRHPDRSWAWRHGLYDLDEALLGTDTYLIGEAAGPHPLLQSAAPRERAASGLNASSPPSLRQLLAAHAPRHHGPDQMAEDGLDTAAGAAPAANRGVLQQAIPRGPAGSGLQPDLAAPAERHLPIANSCQPSSPRSHSAWCSSCRR